MLKHKNVTLFVFAALFFVFLIPRYHKGVPYVFVCFALVSNVCTAAFVSWTFVQVVFTTIASTVVAIWTLSMRHTLTHKLTDQQPTKNLYL